MKLYYSPGSCSLTPHILIKETGLNVALIRVDTATHKLLDGTDYFGINEKGQVPVLELDDGTRLSEGPVIAQLLIDRSERRDLMPAPGSLERYRVMEWQNYITSELHKSYSPLFYLDMPEAMRQTLTGLLRKKYQWVDRQLEGKNYLTGDDFTAADAYLFNVTTWAKRAGLDLSDLSNLQAFQQRAAKRPAVQEAMKTEGLKA